MEIVEKDCQGHVIRDHRDEEKPYGLERKAFADISPWRLSICSWNKAKATALSSRDPQHPRRRVLSRVAYELLPVLVVSRCSAALVVGIADMVLGKAGSLEERASWPQGARGFPCLPARSNIQVLGLSRVEDSQE